MRGTLRSVSKGMCTVWGSRFGDKGIEFGTLGANNISSHSVFRLSQDLERTRVQPALLHIPDWGQ